MKKLNSKILNVSLLLILVVCLTGCKKEKVEEKTTYQVINNLQGLTSFWITYFSENDPGMVKYLDGTMRETQVYCYKGADIVRIDNLGTISPKGGNSNLIEVEPTYDKVRVTFIVTTSESIYYGMAINRLHIVAYTILEKGKNNIISLASGTMVAGGTIE